MARSINRRDFVKGSAAAGFGFWVAGRGAWARGDTPDSIKSPNEKLNVAFVGVNGRAAADLGGVAGCGLANVVALCDVDQRNIAKAGETYPKAKTFTDFRKMYDLKDIDAVVIGTPDHTHAVAAAAAMRLGKHVYCEKPLTHTVHEARVLQELTAEHKLVTQMGTQIHAEDNYRRVVEIVKAGAIGPIKEVHVWCGKTWWAPKLPVGEDKVPEYLDYDLWVGPAPFHTYNHEYLPANWRRYWAYGDGTLGDMACHYMDLPFWALDLASPTKISAEGPAVSEEGCPEELTVHWEFPARGELPPVKLSWYDGKNRPPMMADWGLDPKKVGDGVMFVGEKGALFSNYGSHKLFPHEHFADYVPPPQSIAKSIGHHKEWALACLKNDPSATTCRFSYSGKLTEAVLLGNVAYRVGKPISWDGITGKSDSAEANGLLHYEYRKGWEL